METEIEKCERETGHAQVPGTHFCRCTHAMYDALEDDAPVTYDSLETAGALGEFLPPTAQQTIEYLEAEVLRLAEENRALKGRIDELENRLADAVQPEEIMTALELGGEIERLDLENRALKAGEIGPFRPVIEALTEQISGAATRIAALEERVRELEAEVKEMEWVDPEQERIAALEAEIEALRDANRLLARGSIQATLARSAEVSMAEVMRSDGGQRQLALEAEVEALRADLALATRARPLPLSDGPPDFPLEREAFLAEEPEDLWLLYWEASTWATQARAWELDVEKLQAEVKRLQGQCEFLGNERNQALAAQESLHAEVERLKVINREMAATCAHPDMIATQEGPLGV